MRTLLLIAAGVAIAGLAIRVASNNSHQAARDMARAEKMADSDVATRQAVFAGGCFWGVEHQFQQVEGVISVTSGYIGGSVQDPTYQQVCTGKTGHAEAVLVIYDPAKVNYEKLARLFFEIHDPTQLNRQGPDYGSQYRSAVFYADDQQKAVTEKLIGELRENGYQVVTELVAAGEFYPAEDYHQNYIANRPGMRCHTPVKRFDRPAK